MVNKPHLWFVSSIYKFPSAEHVISHHVHFGHASMQGGCRRPLCVIMRLSDEVSIKGLWEGAKGHCSDAPFTILKDRIGPLSPQP